MNNQEEAIMRLQRFKETSDGTYEWSTFVNKDDLKAFDKAISALTALEKIRAEISDLFLPYKGNDNYVLTNNHILELVVAVIDKYIK